MTDSCRPKPPLPIRLAGRAISLTVARAPALWPLLRGPTRRFWERSAGGWDERVNPDSAEHVAPLAAACDRLPAPPDRILELGTGTGAGARMLAERFPTATIEAVDLSPTMIEAAQARATARVSFTVADAGALPFAGGSFDLVVQLNMPVFPAEVTRVLRPGGHVVVASSLGPATPYYTPERLLARRFTKFGFEEPLTGAVGEATYFMARRGSADALKRYYDKSAPRYNRQISFFERALFGGGREWVCGQARGDVLEIAVGTGRNLRHYPPDVRITGIEYSPGMLELARTEAADVRPDAELHEGDAQALDFPDESFDTVTCTLGLCTIPDDACAVREALRVLRPGGRLLLLEHVRSPVTPVRLGQRALEPIFLRLEHDHLTREPLEHVEAAGFVVERLERSKLGIVERLAARKPS